MKPPAQPDIVPQSVDSAGGAPSAEAFVRRFLGDASRVSPVQTPHDDDFASLEDDALPGALAFEAFSDAPEKADASEPGWGFARDLLDALGFGEPLAEDATHLLLGTDVAKDTLKQRLQYWPRDRQRPYQTLLLDAGDDQALLKSGVFRRLRSEERLEDAVTRLIQTTLTAFQKARPGEVAGGDAEETLVVVSVSDSRWRKGQAALDLVGFGTAHKQTGDLEVFMVTNEAGRVWKFEQPALARQHADGLWVRRFSKLIAGDAWQEAFVSGPERERADALVEICGKLPLDETALEEGVKELVWAVASSFGRGYEGKRITFTRLPELHFIGVDPSGKPPKNLPKLRGLTVRQDAEELLGYVIFVLENGKKAKVLRDALAANNVFRNVLLVWPGGEEGDVELQLWQGTRPLEGKLRKSGASIQGTGRVVELLTRYFVVGMNDLRSPKELARALAMRAKYLRRVVLDELLSESKRSSPDKPVTTLHRYLDAALVKQTPEEFADAYAQAVTYGLLAARWLSRGSQTPFVLASVISLLPSTSPFLRDLFGQLIELRQIAGFSWLLNDLVSLLHQTDVTEVFRDDAKDPVIHFYEDFLDAYDPQIRKDRGVYYTPDEVVRHMVESVHRTLVDDFGLPLGLADLGTWSEVALRNGFDVPAGVDGAAPFVRILDPAVGTGTFLKHTLEKIHQTMKCHWGGVDWRDDPQVDPTALADLWTAYVRDHLLTRMNGLELMMAPYVVCHLRLGLALQETGFKFDGTSKGTRLRVFLSNTLEPTHASQSQLGADPIARESSEADVAKFSDPMTVVIGNPPYEREPADGDGHKGGWVRSGWSGWQGGRALLEDYTKSVRDAGGGGHLKNLYNLYVYFWRWATWRVFERYPGPGIVSFITASSYFRGPGFAGLRQRWREQVDRIDLVDLEGDGRGTRQTPNVFNIQTPVAIAHLVRKGVPKTERGHSAETRYLCIKADDRPKKLRAIDELKDASIVAPTFEGSPTSAFHPGGGGDYGDWPTLSTLFPWQLSGCKAGRTWVIAHEKLTLIRRWRALVASTRLERVNLFKNSPTGQKSHQSPPRLDGRAKRDPCIDDLTPQSPEPPVVRIGFRSFDRQWVIGDSRVLDRAGPGNWLAAGDSQVSIATLMTGVISSGPALTASAHVPDLHHFRGSFGGKDVMPLWRDADATEPNWNASAVALMGQTFGQPPSAEDLFAYVYACLAHPGYVERFQEELEIPGPRVPLTRDPAVFAEGAALGRELLRLHTYGERFRTPNDGFILQGRAKVETAIPETPEAYPERFAYDPTDETLTVGAGRIAEVDAEVMRFSVSGLEVVKSWLGYRMKGGKGKTSSPLDEIRPERWTAELTRELLELLWVLESTITLYPKLDAYLDLVLASPLFLASDLPAPTEAEMKEPKVTRSRGPATGSKPEQFALEAPAAAPAKSRRK